MSSDRVSTKIVVRFTTPGFHRWPEASGKREYLSKPHRHLFHVEVECPVNHHNREVEFHDLLDDARQRFGSGDFDTLSCESMALALGRYLSHKYNRPFRVSVFEDNECGANIELQPEAQ